MKKRHKFHLLFFIYKNRFRFNYKLYEYIFNKYPKNKSKEDIANELRTAIREFYNNRDITIKRCFPTTLPIGQIPGTNTYRIDDITYTGKEGWDLFEKALKEEVNKLINK